MKKYNRKQMAVGVLMGAAVAFSGVAFAANDSPDDFRNEIRSSNQKYQKVNQEVKEALENKDFETFKKVAKGKRVKNLTKEEFDKLVLMHEARESGDWKKFRELKKEMRNNHKNQIRGEDCSHDNYEKRLNR